MNLWYSWYSCVHFLQPACSRRQTFFSMVLVLVGFSIRLERAGVTSFIRAVCLKPSFYKRFLHFLNYSTGLNLPWLTSRWGELVHRLFSVVQVNGYDVYVADGLKVAKEGKKMPGVKKLHQHSANNSKAPYIMGHSFQALALLVRSAKGPVAAVPLVSRIHEGLVESKKVERSLLDKLAKLFLETVSPTGRRALLVADAYYASKKVITPLLQEGHQLLTQVRKNAVAYQEPKPAPAGQRGRPKKYGLKVKLRKYFDQPDAFIQVMSPVYGETNTVLRYRTETLLWRPIGELVRFVWVIHPTRGKIILMCTDVNVDPLTLIQTYGYRFKIEIGFRTAIHAIGSYAYHFWMKAMKPLRQNDGDQDLDEMSEAYRQAIIRKLESYHRFVQLGCIAQGLLQYLAFSHRKEVWSEFQSWLRTMNTEDPPSERVVSYSLRASLLHFLLNSPQNHEFKEILKKNIDFNQIQEYQMAA